MTARIEKNAHVIVVAMTVTLTAVPTLAPAETPLAAVAGGTCVLMGSTLAEPRILLP